MIQIVYLSIFGEEIGGSEACLQFLLLLVLEELAKHHLVHFSRWLHLRREVFKE